MDQWLPRAEVVRGAEHKGTWEILRGWYDCSYHDYGGGYMNVLVKTHRTATQCAKFFIYKFYLKLKHVLVCCKLYPNVWKVCYN